MKRFTGMSRSGQQGVPLDVGIRDVARHAGVAVGTVSNVLNRPEAVGAATRERVLDAIAALGFVRNESARHLRAGSSRTLGLVVLDVANPFFTDVARGVDDVAAEHGLAVLLCNSDDQPRRESDQLGLLLEQRVQGVVITPTAELSPALDTVRRRGVPLVLLDRRAPTADQCSVAVDDELGGRLAAEHLLEAGHRRIAFVGGTTPLPQLQERLTGVRTAVRERTGDDAALTVLSPASLTVAGGREAAQQLLGIPAARRPTAAVCANDLLALGMLQELVRHGVDVPGEVALVGYDDIEFAAAAAVPLTSVRKPRAELGRLAASMVLEEASDPGHVHRQVVLDPVLVVRESSAGRAGVRRGEGIA